MRCTVLEARRGSSLDWEVTAPVGTRLEELVRVLGRAGASASVGNERLDPGRPLGRPPLLHGCLLVLDGCRSNDGDPGPGGLHLDVVAGPDAGRSLRLAPGSYVLGRAEPARLTLGDPRVSRRHAVLTVHHDAVTAQDLGSSNGTWLEGRPATQRDAGTRSRTPVLASPRSIAVGDRLHLGGSTTELRLPRGRPASVRLRESGRLEVNRPPRRAASEQPVVLARPRPPRTPARSGTPWVGMAVPLVLCVGAAWLLRQPSYLLFGLMSPLVLAGTSLADRWGRRRRLRADAQRWHEQVATVERRADLALAEERAALRHVVGDPPLLGRLAHRRGSRLWERTGTCDDALLVGLGTGTVPSSRVSWAPPQLDVDGLSDAASTGAGAPAVPTLHDAPVTVDLSEHHLGLCGDRRLVLRLARWVLAQVVVWHSPDVVQVIVLDGSGTDEWRWTRWLPHLLPAPGSSTAELAGVVDDVVRRRHERRAGGRREEPRLVVLVDGSDPRRAPALARAYSAGTDVGVHVICLADDPTSLPSATGAVSLVSEDGSLRVDRGGQRLDATVDGTSRAWAETLARDLAPLVDATPSPERLPGSVQLLDLLPVDATSPGQLAELWRRQPRSTRAVIGQGLDGPIELDLALEGPHALVAGTTGSGKSELLRTLVTSLAVVNRPDEMTFLLVDYKGGAAFRGCAELPHTAGLVTDLDDRLAVRALDGLDCELRRRERLLHDARCRDVDEYHAARDDRPELPALPRLVMVIDEFRVLAAELPDFLEGVVRVASVGRSLGVHLVLATQRPGGVVTADIKANVNLRLCLRVRDRVDSDDVLDSAEAAAISPAFPGRAFVRRGGEALTAVQVATVGGRRLARSEPLRVRPIGAHDDWWRPRRSADDDPDALTRGDLGRVADACARAAADLRTAPACPVWTPPLPERLLPADVDRDGVPRGAIPLGLVDLPHEQRQEVLAWHPVGSGHLAISGASRTGRTSALLTLAAGLMGGWAPHELQLHVIDAGHGPLQSLSSLPHTGTVVTADQPRLVARLVDRLTAEVSARRLRGATAGDSAAPALVLLVDGWEALCDRLDAVDHGRPVDQLVALLRDSEAQGFRAVITGGRGVLLSRVAAVVGERLLLRPNDPTDLLLAGVAVADVPARQPPGRAVRASDGAHAQITVPPSPEAVQQAARRWAPRDQLPPERRPVRLMRLPDTVDASRLVPTVRPATWALVGCGGDEGDPVGIDVAEDRFVLVAGPSGSGRSTALVTMAASLHDRHLAVLAICPRPSPLSTGPWDVLEPGQRGQQPPQWDRYAAIIVDDAEQLRDHPWEAALCAVVDSRTGPAVVLAGTTSVLLGGVRGLAARGPVHRTGLVLQPGSASDGEVLGVRAQLDDVTPPGRGILVVRGRQLPVQVATWTHAPQPAG
jgi:S-DNA-T family DNA segregation ATPase FtsK/SpoIIIE